jgi:tripartite-type tricarboxylate transporter receptor subunit TctC
MPDVPTLAESVPGYEAIGWQGIGAPKGTPSAVIDRLNEAINAGLRQPELQARFAMQGGTPLTGSPADFARLVAADTEKWGKVIRAAHIRAE